MTQEQVQPALSESGELEPEVPGPEQELDTQVASLKEQLATAAQKYRGLLLATAPEIPEELVTGDTPEEVEASFTAARDTVEKVRRQLEARAQAERVPAGAPPRTAPDLGALSPQEKIAYALSRPSQTP